MFLNLVIRQQNLGFVVILQLYLVMMFYIIAVNVAVFENTSTIDCGLLDLPIYIHLPETSAYQFHSTLQRGILNATAVCLDDTLKRWDRIGDRINYSIENKPFLEIFGSICIPSSHRKV